MTQNIFVDISNSFFLFFFFFILEFTHNKYTGGGGSSSLQLNLPGPLPGVDSWVVSLVLDGVTVNSQLVPASVTQMSFAGLKPGVQYTVQIASQDGTIQLPESQVQTAGKAYANIMYCCCCCGRIVKDTSL